MQCTNPSKTSQYLLPESVYKWSFLRKRKGYSEASREFYEKGNDQEKLVVRGAFIERHVLSSAKNTVHLQLTGNAAERSAEAHFQQEANRL